MNGLNSIFKTINKVKVNKRGNAYLILISVLMILMLTAIGIFYITLHKTMQPVVLDLKDKMGSEGDAILDQSNNTFPQTTDRAVVIAFVGFWAFALLAGFVAPEHPIVALILVFIIIMIAGLGAYYSNVWDDYVSDPSFATERPLFPKTDFILTHFVELVLVVGFSSLYVYYLRSSRTTI